MVLNRDCTLVLTRVFEPYRDPSLGQQFLRAFSPFDDGDSYIGLK